MSVSKENLENREKWVSPWVVKMIQAAFAMGILVGHQGGCVRESSGALQLDVPGLESCQRLGMEDG